MITWLKITLLAEIYVSSLKNDRPNSFEDMNLIRVFLKHACKDLFKRNNMRRHFAQSICLIHVDFDKKFVYKEACKMTNI